MLIRNIDDRLKERLRVRAAMHGRSMEEEARTILREGVEGKEEAINIVDLALELFGPEKGIDLEIPPREFGGEPPDFR